MRYSVSLILTILEKLTQQSCPLLFNLVKLYFLGNNSLKGVLSLCKLVGIDIPSDKEIKALVDQAFEEIDVDENGEISLEEFKQWIETEDEIQDFLLFYTNYQTGSHAIQIYSKYFEVLGISVLHYSAFNEMFW
jgi:hypothetical protein